MYKISLPESLESVKAQNFGTIDTAASQISDGAKTLMICKWNNLYLCKRQVGEANSC